MPKKCLKPDIDHSCRFLTFQFGAGNACPKLNFIRESGHLGEKRSFSPKWPLFPDKIRGNL